jgi:hypothetical protein
VVVAEPEYSVVVAVELVDIYAGLLIFLVTELTP